MNTRESSDRLLSTWLELEAPATVPDDLRTDIHRATARIRPRPAWLARLRGSSMDVINGGATARPQLRLAPVLAVFLLVLAIAAGVVFVGSNFSKPPTAPLPSETPPVATVTPAASPDTTPIPTPIPTPISDSAIDLPFKVSEIVPGETATWVSIVGEDTDEFARAIYRIDHGTTSANVVVSDIGAAPNSPVSILESGGSLWAVEAGSNKLIRFNPDDGKRLDEFALGPFPIQQHAAFDTLWSPIYDEGALQRIDPATGEFGPKITIDQFNGQGPVDLAQGQDLLWAVAVRTDLLVGIDPTANQVATESELAADLHCEVVVLGGRVWVAPCDHGRPIQVFDDASGEFVGAVALPAAGHTRPVFEADGVVWIPSFGDTTTIVPYDAETLQPAAAETVDLGAPVEWLVPDDGAIWYSVGSTVYRLSTSAFTG